ncbi:hypothetical protein AGOR_G00223330 [Albula goreensis]|uniref:Uncharacterized protein n=1 Tax=Albula goreensis TaxID=1534307 RepID=A0A8T3CN03_9TELE|nr:hypothetical protein AGOR_G00223330 [Albula goreensis]
MKRAQFNDKEETSNLQLHLFTASEKQSDRQRILCRRGALHQVRISNELHCSIGSSVSECSWRDNNTVCHSV